MKGWYLFEALSSINEEGNLHILVFEAVQKFAQKQEKLPVTKDNFTLSKLAVKEETIILQQEQKRLLCS
jgi:hypothetical protein